MKFFRGFIRRWERRKREGEKKKTEKEKWPMVKYIRVSVQERQWHSRRLEGNRPLTSRATLRFQPLIKTFTFFHDESLLSLRRLRIIASEDAWLHGERWRKWERRRERERSYSGRRGILIRFWHRRHSFDAFYESLINWPDARRVLLSGSSPCSLFLAVIKVN